MTRITTLGLLTLIMVSASGTCAQTATATDCFETIFAGDGGYTTSACMAVGNGNFVKANDTLDWKRIGPSAYCTRVSAGNKSFYATLDCAPRLGASTDGYAYVNAQAGFVLGTIRPLYVRASSSLETFTTNAGSLECETLAGEAHPTTTKATVLAFSANYGGCKAFGAKVIFSEANESFFSEGALGIVSKNILVKDTEGKCSINILAGGSNKELMEMNYSNTSKGMIRVAINIKGINYESSGGPCGTKTTLEKNGTYKGEAEIEDKSGKVEVDLAP